MSRAAHLMLEAKKAITDEQLQRFLSLAQQEHWEDAAKQFGVTLACVADLLDEGAETLLALEPPVTQPLQSVQREIEAPGDGNREHSSGSRKA